MAQEILYIQFFVKVLNTQAKTGAIICDFQSTPNYIL